MEFKWMLAVAITFLAWGLLASCAQPSKAESILIDCGSSNGSVHGGLEWQADSYFLGGNPLTITNVEGVYMPQDLTLRVFNTGEISCYLVPTLSGRHLVRLSFAYNNFDGKNDPPKFIVYLEGVLMERVDMAEEEILLKGSPYHSDYYVYVRDGECEICLYPLRGQVTFLNTLQIFLVEDKAYESAKLAPESFLSNFIRINSGGPSIYPSQDLGFRKWMADAVETKKEIVERRCSEASLQGVDEAPDFLPVSMFCNGRQAGNNGFLSYSWILPSESSLHEWMVRLYFVEVKPGLHSGDRVFDISVNDHVVGAFDIYQATNGNYQAAVSLTFFVNATLPRFDRTSNLFVSLISTNGSIYAPVLSGIEIYEIIPVHSTRENVLAELRGEMKRRSSKGKLSSAQIAAIGISSAGTACFIIALAILARIWRIQQRHEEAPMVDGSNSAQHPAPYSRRINEMRPVVVLDREQAFLEHRYGGLMPGTAPSVYERGESSAQGAGNV